MIRLSMGLMASLLLLLAAPASAASFDCAKASSEIEKRICANSALGAADELLADSYRRARERDPANANALRQEQRAWLRLVREQCFEDDCLARALTRRTVGLEQPREGQIPRRAYGQFSRTDEACFVANNEEGRSCEGEIDSSILVLPEGLDRVGVYALLFFFNGHTCQFEGQGQWQQGKVVVNHYEENSCQLTLSYDESGITTAATEPCRDYCGMRGTLDGIELERR